MGVSVVAIIGCENQTPVEALGEQQEISVVDQESQSLDAEGALEFE